MIMTAASTFAATLRVATLLPALSLATPSDLAAQASGTVYERRDECIEAGKLTRGAMRLRLSQRPRRIRAEGATLRLARLCERSHKRCGAQVTSTGGWDHFGRGGATYVPRFTGVRVTGEGMASRAYPGGRGRDQDRLCRRGRCSLDDKVCGAARHGRRRGRSGALTPGRCSANTGPYEARRPRRHGPRADGDQADRLGRAAGALCRSRRGGVVQAGAAAALGEP